MADAPEAAAGTVAADVKKALHSKTGLVVAAVAALGLGYLWWRNHQAAMAANSADAIDPLTGLPYSAELGQPTGVNAATGATDGTGTTTDPGSPLAPTNATWTQDVVDALGQTMDESAVLAALGDYLAGVPLTTAEAAIVRQAWAVAGKPPGGPSTYTLAQTSSTPGGPPHGGGGTNPPPPPSSSGPYVVKSGDTLSSIARSHGISDWHVILHANQATITEWAAKHGKPGDGNWIYPGEPLTIPSK